MQYLKVFFWLGILTFSHPSTASSSVLHELREQALQGNRAARFELLDRLYNDPTLFVQDEKFTKQLGVDFGISERFLTIRRDLDNFFVLEWFLTRAFEPGNIDFLYRIGKSGLQLRFQHLMGEHTIIFFAHVEDELALSTHTRSALHSFYGKRWVTTEGNTRPFFVEALDGLMKFVHKQLQDPDRTTLNQLGFYRHLQILLARYQISVPSLDPHLLQTVFDRSRPSHDIRFYEWLFQYWPAEDSQLLSHWYELAKQDCPSLKSRRLLRGLLTKALRECSSELESE